MKFWSNDFKDGQRLPVQFGAGKPDGAGRGTFSDNLNPHLAWSDLPAGTQSLVLICHDYDVPSKGDDVNKPDREVPEDLPRVDFFHWVLVDLPASVTEIRQGEFSQGFTAKGKPGPDTLHGARHGINDFTNWFASDPQNAGQYFGYDGPFPPFNDSLMHHYVFTLYALSVTTAQVQGVFDGEQVRAAIEDHVLDQVTLTGTYTLNARLL